MPNEIAYAISKGALHQMTASLADAVIDRGVTVNCINPGPIDTGYATGISHKRVAKMFPAKRWDMPEDIAKRFAWLVSDEAAWTTRQVHDRVEGFRRWTQAWTWEDSPTSSTPIPREPKPFDSAATPTTERA